MFETPLQKLLYALAGKLGLGLMILALGFGGLAYVRTAIDGFYKQKQQNEELKRENSRLATNLKGLQEENEKLTASIAQTKEVVEQTVVAKEKVIYRYVEAVRKSEDKIKAIEQDQSLSPQQKKSLITDINYQTILNGDCNMRAESICSPIDVVGSVVLPELLTFQIELGDLENEPSA